MMYALINAELYDALLAELIMGMVAPLESWHAVPDQLAVVANKGDDDDMLAVISAHPLEHALACVV